MTVIHSIYRQSGLVVIDQTLCTACGSCAKACPAEVLQMADRGVHISDSSRFGCIACGHCMMVCPEDAISVSGRGIAKQDLTAMPAASERTGADALAALMKSRRSVRHFQDKPVEAGLVNQVVEMAETAPMGIPPWDIGCVTVIGREHVQAIADEIVTGYQGFLTIFRPWLLKLLRPFLGTAKYEIFTHFIRPLAETYVANHKIGCDKLFYNAPALLIFHHSPYAEALDAAIACTYAMLAAESLGLGSTIIGGASPILQRNKKLCTTLGIPSGNTPSIALILGYPAIKFRKTIHRHFTHITTFPANR